MDISKYTLLILLESGFLYFCYSKVHISCISASKFNTFSAFFLGSGFVCLVVHLEIKLSKIFAKLSSNFNYNLNLSCLGIKSF